MIGIYESILSDPKYTCDIKAPMDQALLDGGHIKDGKGKRKLPPMLALTDRSGGTPSSAPHVSAGQKRAAAREAGVSKGSPDGGEGGGSSSLYWLHGTGIGSGRQPRNKRQRTDSGPSSGGRRKKKRRGRYDDSDEEEDDPDDFLPSDDDDDDDDADAPTLMLTDKSGGEGAVHAGAHVCGGEGEEKRVKAEERASGAKAASAAAKAERKRAADAGAAAKARKAEKAAMRTPFAGCDRWLRVEVEQVDEGYLGAWFAGTVTGHAAPDKLALSMMSSLSATTRRRRRPST